MSQSLNALGARLHGVENEDLGLKTVDGAAPAMAAAEAYGPSGDEGLADDEGLR
jgi:hypothetical protein